MPQVQPYVVLYAEYEFGALTLFKLMELYAQSPENVKEISLKNTLIQKYAEPYEDEEQQNLIDVAGSARALKYGYVTYGAQ